MLTLLGTRLYVPRSQQQEPPAISSSSAASTSSLLQRDQSSDQNELPYQSSPSASAATDPSYPSNAIASLLTSSTAGSSNPLSLAQKDHLLTETFPHLTSLRATSHRYSEASKSQKLQVAEAKSRLDEARLELENRRLEEMELMEEIRRETSNDPHFEGNGVGPSSSSPITKPWLDSIDAVYKLFEDANLRAQYPTLAPKVQSAVQLCEEVIRELGLEKCALSFNGGKDCTVVVHILAAVLRRLQGSTSSSQLVPIPSVYITCPSPFPVLETFIRDSQTRYNLSLATVPGGMKEGLVEYFEGGGRAGVVPDLQTNGQEKSPNRPVEGYRDVKAIFIGTRRTDPGGDTLDPRKWTDPSWPQVERIHPILDWDYADVWAFLRCPALGCSQIPEVQGEAKEPGVPYCTLYDEGYTSLGSTFNTFPNPTLKVESVGSKESFRPAWQLQDASSERDGRGDQKK